MNIRKLVKSGHSSLVLAVPKEWIDKHKLKQGDNVYLDQEGAKLVVLTDFKERPSEKKTKTILVDGKSGTTVYHEITSAYIDSYTYICIKGKDLPKLAKEVKQVINQLVALELVEESSDKIVARSFLNLYDTDPKLLIRRLDNIIRSMMIDTKESAKNPCLVPSVIDRDYEVNRLSFLMLKLLKTAYLDDSILSSMKLDKLDLIRFWELNIHLEKIADRTKNIASIMPLLQGAKKNKFLELFCELEGLYKEAMQAFHKMSAEESDRCSQRRRKTVENIQKYIQNNECAVCSQAAINAYNMLGNINDICRVSRYLGL